jgi:hypothetical protein
MLRGVVESTGESNRPACTKGICVLNEMRFKFAPVAPMNLRDPYAQNNLGRKLPSYADKPSYSVPAKCRFPA